MVELIARCGFRCDLCLGYRENVERDGRNRQTFRDGLERYYGDKLTLEECYCDGCLAEDSGNPVLITKDCRIRSCVISKGLQNCGLCERCPCSDVANKVVERSKVEARLGGPMPDEDYRSFVMPYESRRVLDGVRQGKY